MDCPSCDAVFPDDAVFCPSCGWKVSGDPIDLAAANLMKVSREIIEGSLRAAEKTAVAVGPVLDATAREVREATKPIVDAARPAVKRAARATSKAVDEGVRIGTKAAHKAAESAATARGKMRKKRR